MKYMTRMGQNTGTLNASKKVQTMATRMPLVAECLKGGGEGSASEHGPNAAQRPLAPTVSPQRGAGATPPGTTRAGQLPGLHHAARPTAPLSHLLPAERRPASPGLPGHPLLSGTSCSVPRAQNTEQRCGAHSLQGFDPTHTGQRGHRASRPTVGSPVLPSPHHADVSASRVPGYQPALVRSTAPPKVPGAQPHMRGTPERTGAGPAASTRRGAAHGAGQAGHTARPSGASLQRTERLCPEATSARFKELWPGPPASTGSCWGRTNVPNK